MFLNVTTPANSYSNESASIKSASHSTNHANNTGSSKANSYKNTTFDRSVLSICVEHVELEAGLDVGICKGQLQYSLA